MKKIKLHILVFVFLASTGFSVAQVDIQKQLDQIPMQFTNYVDGYMNDLTSNQGFAFLNSLNTSGKVLNQWELVFKLSAGSGLSKNYVNADFGPNFIVSGVVPSLFGSAESGELFFQFLDDETGLPLYNPFTGDQFGFDIPLLPGLGLGYGLSPAVMPVLSLGVGYGTEVSFGILPGVLGLGTKNLSDDFTLDNDLMMSVGLKHNVFNWVPALNEKNYYLSLGINYSLVSLGASFSPALFGGFDLPESEYYSLTNTLSGMEYRSSNIGFELIATKKLAFVDLSLFGAYHSSLYTVQSIGGIDLSVANSFKVNNPDGFTSYTIDNLIDVNSSFGTLFFGAAAQFNVGPVSLGLKYGIGNVQYAAVNLGFRILKGN